MAKIQELRDLGDAELFERLELDKEELFNLRFQLATGQLDNPMRIKTVRHEVARILTILRQREMEVEAEEAEAFAAAREAQAREARAHAKAQAAQAGSPAHEAEGPALEGEDGSDTDTGSSSEAVAPEGERAKRGLLRKKKEQNA